MGDPPFGHSFLMIAPVIAIIESQVKILRLKCYKVGINYIVFVMVGIILSCVLAFGFAWVTSLHSILNFSTRAKLSLYMPFTSYRAAICA